MQRNRNSKLTGLAIQPVVAPVREQIVATLRNAIITGQLQPGERLIESSMASMLNVSRTSIREAVRQLEAEKLVSTIPFKGPSVATMTLEEAEHIYEVRSLLESQAAAICAQRATQQDVTRIGKALKRFEDAVKQRDAKARIEATDEFYAGILASWNNSVVIEVLAGLQSRINYLRFKSMSLPERAHNSLQELTAIYEAIASRSPEAAATAAKVHINNAYTNAKAMLEREKDELDR